MFGPILEHGISTYTGDNRIYFSQKEHTHTPSDLLHSQDFFFCLNIQSPNPSINQSSIHHHQSIHQLDSNPSNNQFIRQFIHQFIHPSIIYQFIHQFIHPSIYASINPSINLSMNPSINSSINLSINSSTNQPIHQSFHNQTIHQNNPSINRHQPIVT